ncbi:hypothetical protein NQ314_007460 [Rhamnusium bicolor]|uniref:Uncharacterized protein n=1 Tax=Rhamnusium bicolor TaxID=1586634 RepID=A0AAV8YQH8_9CUCU|nr:hypothetical protein NQ314_007460 [Rhamnusium bicolor]
MTEGKMGVLLSGSEHLSGIGIGTSGSSCDTRIGSSESVLTKSITTGSSGLVVPTIMTSLSLSLSDTSMYGAGEWGLSVYIMCRS